MSVELTAVLFIYNALHQERKAIKKHYFTFLHMFEVEAMNHYSQSTEAQVHYGTGLRSRCESERQLGMEAYLLH